MDGTTPVEGAVAAQLPESDSVCTLAAEANDVVGLAKDDAVVPLPLVCGLCGKDYNKPKLLPCFHTHCTSCLESLAPANSLSIHCPKCMLQFILPAGGVASLMDNALFGQYAGLSDSENHQITSEQLTGKKSDDAAPACLTHAGHFLTFYCRTCDKLLCDACTKSDPECFTHKIDTVKDVAKAQRLLLLDLLKRTESSFPTLLTARTRAKATVSTLKQKYVTIREEMQRLFSDLHSLLTKREHQLANILEVKFAEKRKALEAQESELARAIDSYNKTRQFLDTVVLTGSDADVIIVKKEMSDFYATLNSRSMACVKNSDVMKLTTKLEELRKEIETFGTIDTNNAVAIETCVEGSGVKSVYVQEQRSFRVILKDAAGQFVSMPVDEGELQVDIKSPFNDPLPVRIVYDGSGVYSVYYQTEYPGSYEISVRLRGEPIKDSPFTVRSFRREQLSNGQLASHLSPTRRYDDRSSARSVSIVHRNRTFSPGSASASVCSVRSRSKSQGRSVERSSIPSSRSAAMLQKAMNGSQLTRSKTTVGGGSSRSTIVASPHHMSRFSSSFISSPQRMPTPLIGSSRSVIYQSVLSPGGKRSLSVDVDSVSVAGTSTSGAFAAMRIGHRGQNVGQFMNPQGIGYSASLNALIVADSANHNVQLFDCRSAHFIRQFGVRGRGEGQLLKPAGVAEYHRGSVHQLLVTDFENKCVNVYDADGKYKERLGEMKVVGPKGIAVDHEGRILVADHRGGCVCVFSGTTKKLIQRIGSRGSGEHQLGAPYYVAVNANNDIVVSDFQHRKVKLFNAEGRFLFSFSLASGRGSTGQVVTGPTGVAVDEKDRILVAEWASSTVQLFDNNGCFLQYVNTSADPLVGPHGLSVTSTYGAVAVADTGNYCVKIYRYQ